MTFLAPPLHARRAVHPAGDVEFGVIERDPRVDDREVRRFAAAPVVLT